MPPVERTDPVYDDDDDPDDVLEIDSFAVIPRHAPLPLPVPSGAGFGGPGGNAVEVNASAPMPQGHLIPLPAPPARSIYPAEGQPIPVPQTVPNAPRMPLPVDNITPWDQEIKAENITGAFDAWVAKVIEVIGDPDRAETGYVQEIKAIRAGAHWDANNEPNFYEVPQVWSQPTGVVVAALPWPARHDQQRYHVAVGDYVTIISGRDDRHYFFSDDLPFVAMVVAQPKAGGDPDGAVGKWEDNAGGAGLLVLKVRRQALSGDPAAGPAGLGALLTAAGAAVEYANILVVGPTNVHHGYRAGDLVWVQKRGRYHFVQPVRETFKGFLTDQGPNGEEDFDDSRYWVRETDTAITYSVNTWAISGVVVRSDATVDDPSESGGRWGRWVQATNIGEQISDAHDLKVSEDPADPSLGMPVIVSMFADPADGEPLYMFNLALEYKGDGVWIGNEDDGKAAEFLPDETGVRVVEHLTIGPVGPGVTWHSVTIDNFLPDSPPAGPYIPVSQFTEQLDTRRHGYIEEGDPGYVSVVGYPECADIYIGEVNKLGGVSVAPCDKITFYDTDTVVFTVADDGNDDAIVTADAIITDIFIGEVTNGAEEGDVSVAPCDKITFDDTETVFWTVEDAGDGDAVVSADAGIYVTEDNEAFYGPCDTLFFADTSTISWTIGDGPAMARADATISAICTRAPAHDILSTPHPDTDPAEVVRGDLIAGQWWDGGTVKWQRLEIGTSGQVLSVSGQDAVWAAPAGVAHDILSEIHADAETADVVIGDLITGQVAGEGEEWKRLPIGDSGHVLTSTGGIAVWSPPAEGPPDTGPGISCSGWIVVGGNATITLDLRNWTGREVSITCHWYDADKDDADHRSWHDAVTPGLIGSGITGGEGPASPLQGYFTGDERADETHIIVCNPGVAGGLNTNVFHMWFDGTFEGEGGQLKFQSWGFDAEPLVGDTYQVAFWVRGSPRYTDNNYSCP